MAADRFLFAWRWALASEYGPKSQVERHVAQTLSLYANADGQSMWASQETLAVRTGLSERSVRDALTELCKWHWFSRIARKSRRGVRSKRHGYEYTATLPGKLAIAYVKGELRSVFEGKEPRKLRPEKNTESDDRRKGNHVPTNTSGEYKNLTFNRKRVRTPEEERAEAEEFERYEASLAPNCAQPEIPPVPAEVRRQRAVEFIDAHLNVGRAYSVDVNTEPGMVIVTAADRDGRCEEISVPREDFEPAKLRRMLEPRVAALQGVVE